jgi:hypothetical protein
MSLFVADATPRTARLRRNAPPDRDNHAQMKNGRVNPAAILIRQ